MNRPETQAHIETNIHPNYRSLGLGQIRMVRRMMREGRYVSDCKAIIKDAQQDLATKRRKLAAWSQS